MKLSMFARAALGVCAAAALLAGCRGSGTLPQTANVPAAPFRVEPLTGVDRAQLYAERAAGRTIPFFTGSVKSPLDHKTYGYDFIGDDPKTSTGTTYVPYVLIAVAYRFRDGTVLDPTKPACNDAVSIQQRVLQGPDFVATDLTSNGVDVGNVQYGDAFQRAEFWTALKSPNYHVVLRPARAPVVIRVKAPSGSSTAPGVCAGKDHRVGTVPYPPFAELVHRLSKKYATARQIPIVINYNIIESLGGGGSAVGAHGAFKRSSGIQPYIFASYSDAGSVPGFASIADIMALSHEIAETFNDPFPLSGLSSSSANSTPPWGHIGVYAFGCSNYLEVGDPLLGVTFEADLNGFTYHPQDLAFASWFFRTKSLGTGGLYSFKGTFKRVQGRCK